MLSDSDGGGAVVSAGAVAVVVGFAPAGAAEVVVVSGGPYAPKTGAAAFELSTPDSAESPESDESPESESSGAGWRVTPTELQRLVAKEMVAKRYA